MSRQWMNLHQVRGVYRLTLEDREINAFRRRYDATRGHRKRNLATTAFSMTPATIYATLPVTAAND
jgi:hypothetical protein